MFAALSTTVGPAGTKRRGALSRLLGACRDGIVVYFQRRAAIKSLSELDDRALRDIGLVRSQIEAAALGFMTDPSRAGM
jgi:uncharacterized protein YjiS (DUF1127 family)